MAEACPPLPAGVPLPAPVGADVPRVQVICFGWRNLRWCFPLCREAKELFYMEARGVRHEKIMKATDAVGWRVDTLIEAKPYFDVCDTPTAASHLGFHSSHLQRLLTRDKGLLQRAEGAHPACAPPAQRSEDTDHHCGLLLRRWRG